MTASRSAIGPSLSPPPVPLQLQPAIAFVHRYSTVIAIVRVIFRRRWATFGQSDYPDSFPSLRSSFWDHLWPLQWPRSSPATSLHPLAILLLLGHFSANRWPNFVGCHHHHTPHHPPCRLQLSAFFGNRHHLPHRACLPTFTSAQLCPSPPFRAHVRVHQSKLAQSTQLTSLFNLDQVDLARHSLVQPSWLDSFVFSRFQSILVIR